MNYRMPKELMIELKLKKKIEGLRKFENLAQENVEK